MKYLFVITVFTAMLVQTFSKALIMADFYFNRQQITEALCENKDKPQLACEGHCQLKKELEKESKSETVQLLKEIAPFINSTISIELSTPEEPVLEQIYPVNDNRLFGYAESIFRPPLS